MLPSEPSLTLSLIYKKTRCLIMQKHDYAKNITVCRSIKILENNRNFMSNFKRLNLQFYHLLNIY